MVGLSLIPIVVLVGIALIAFLVYQIWFKNTNISKGKTPPIIDLYADVQAKNETKQVEKPPEIIEIVTTDGPLNALVLDDAHRTFGLRHIETFKGKDYGRPRLYLTNMVFWVHRLSTGQIEPVPYSIHQNLEHSPRETYRAVNTKEKSRILWGKRSEVDRVKLWIIILGICALVFIGWMAVSGKKTS